MRACSGDFDRCCEHHACAGVSLDRCCEHQRTHLLHALNRMCICTHVFEVCFIVLGCEPWSRDETPGGPEESKWTKSRRTYIRICVQSTHLHLYAQRRDEILD